MRDHIHDAGWAADQRSGETKVRARWPAVIAALATGALFYTIPDTLTIGPGWLVLALVALLMVPTTLTHRTGRHDLNNILAYTTLGVITVAVFSSLVLLVTRLPAHKDPPLHLLRAAGALWLANMLVFASWYWRLDGGGPNARDKRGVHTDGAFLFPQMLMTLSSGSRWARTTGARASSTICFSLSTQALHSRRPMCPSSPAGPRR